MLTAKHFIVTKKRNPNTDEINKWFRECQRLHRPYIVIKTRTKYANIDFDHTSMPKGYDKLLKLNADKIGEEVSRLKKIFGITKSKIECNVFLISFRNIPIENSEKLANELHDYINRIVN